MSPARRLPVPNVIASFFDFQRSIRDELVAERLMVMLSGFSGFLAALLAMMGVYGLISLVAVMWRNEISIGMAPGASPGNVVSIMLRTLVPLALGIAVGVVVALAATRAAKSLPIGTSKSSECSGERQGKHPTQQQPA